MNPEDIEKIEEMTEKLKAAGYPNIGKAWKEKESDAVVFHEVPGWEEIYIPPSLSELIEKLGNDLHGMQRVESVSCSDGTLIAKGWQAIPYPIDYAKAEIASTLEVALSNLWLSLNKR